MSKTTTTRRNHFSDRLKEHYDELRQTYLDLYHDEASFKYFIEMLKKNYQERRASLRKSDIARSADPEWYHSQKMLGMMMYTECFAGDLKGVREKLPYISQCGVNYLHLMPLLDSPEGKSDGGYAVSDFRKVRPELGTIDDLKDLSAACHRKGILLCLDFVLNHTSEDHAWAKAARAGDATAQSRYFFYDNWDIPDQYNKTVPEVFPETAPGNFTYLNDCNKIVMTTFHTYQWDLNYANPMVFNDMTDNMLYLANLGMDIIRLDAIPYIWKQLGTNCRNLPQVHKITRMMNIACSIVCPGVLLLGEVVMEPKEVVPYFSTPETPECDMLYNVTTMCTIWHTIATKDTRLLRFQMDQIKDLPENCVFQNYLRCHDDIGWGLDYAYLGQFGMLEAPHKKFLNDWFTGNFPGSPSRGELYNDSEVLRDARLCGTTASLCGIESAIESGDDRALETALQADLMLHAFMLTLKGIPVLYSGDEIGMVNDYTYHDHYAKWDDSRFVHRGALRWDLVDKIDEKDTLQSVLFNGIKKLTDIRKKNRIFHQDAYMYSIETGNYKVLGLMKEFEGQKFIALFNFDPDKCSIDIDVTGYKDMLQNSRKAYDGHLNEIESYGFRWLIKK